MAATVGRFDLVVSPGVPTCRAPATTTPLRSTSSAFADAYLPVAIEYTSAIRAVARATAAATAAIDARSRAELPDWAAARNAIDEDDLLLVVSLL